MKGIPAKLNVEVIRRADLERRNGLLETWWHYNRLTLAVALLVICSLVGAGLLSRQRAAATEFRAQQVYEAARPALGCWEQSRATTLVIAGGSQRQVYDSLYSAEQELARMRGAVLIANAGVPRP